MTFDPTEEQASIIDLQESALVNAGPGTGKTRTAIEKALVTVREFDANSSEKVLFLSFSNAAVNRLAECAGLKFSYAQKRHVTFVTYHSCASNILTNYGRFIGLPPKIRIMDTLEERMISLERDWASSDLNYDELLYAIAKDEGLIGFKVIIPLATKVLQCSSELKNIYSRRFPLIVVDEFQDTSREQWLFLKELGDQSQVVAFGDPNQIIYESLHNATQDRLEEYRSWKSIRDSAFSIDNFRCQRPTILQFANALLTGSKYKIEDEDQVQLFKLKNRTVLRSTVALIWMEINKTIKDGQTIGILAPSNAIAEQAAIDLRNPPSGSPVKFKVYARIPRDEAAFDSILLALAAFRDYAMWGTDEFCRKAALAILAMEFAWNPRRKKVPNVRKLLKRLEKSRSRDGTLLSKVIGEIGSVTSICDLLPDFINALNENGDFKTTFRRIAAHERLGISIGESLDPQLSFFDEIRNNRHPKGLEGYNAYAGKTQILNYHKAKGREFDFVIMVMDPRGESKDVSVEEKSRLCYVCATRAKEWLGVIYYRGEYGPVLGRVIASV